MEMDQDRAKKLKPVMEPRAAVIVIRDGDKPGQMSLALQYHPPLKDEEELTPAQAFGSHAFSFVKNLFDNLKAQEMDEAELVTPERVIQAADEIKAQKNRPIRVSVTPQDRFKIPNIVPGEINDLKTIEKERKGKR